MGCGQCRKCVSGHNNRCANYGAIGITKKGAFAEFMRIPAAATKQGNLIPVNGSTDPAAAAALIEPFACVLRDQNGVNVQLDDVVLIIGAGPIGVMHIMLAKLRGRGDGGNRWRRRRRDHRGGPGPRGPGECLATGRYRRANQLLRRAAQGPANHQLRFEYGSLQGT